MKAVFQRVASAEVRSAGRVTGRIGPGAVILLGVGRADTEADAARLADKVAKLRVFDDAEGKMNLAISSVADGKFIVVSQFTLFGSTTKGNLVQGHMRDENFPLKKKLLSCKWRSRGRLQNDLLVFPQGRINMLIVSEER